LREPAGTDVALSGKLGALTETAPASDTASSGLNGRLQRIAQRITSLIALVPAALTPSGRFKVGKKLAIVTASVIRPADTTTYTAGDAVTDSDSAPTIITFANCAGGSGGDGVIMSAQLIDEANQVVKGTFELWIFSTAITPNNDNAAFAPSNANMEDLIAVIPFPTTYVGLSGSGAAGNVAFPAAQVNIPFVCAVTSLYGELVVRNAYVPVESEKFYIKLLIAQN
jgi:hypothetical protein